MPGATARAKLAVAIRHVPFEDLGILQALLTDRGYSVAYREAGVEPLQEETTQKADLLVVLGGPIGAYEDDRYPFLVDELRLLEKRCADRLPTLGICLGAQLLARCLGGRVFSLGSKEIGFAPLELTESGQRSALQCLAGVPVLHWHGDTYSLPKGARRLAFTAVCPEQAFDVGETILALQFHVEWDVGRFEQWLIGHAVELAAAGIDPRTLREKAREFGAKTLPLRKQCLATWLESLETHVPTRSRG